MNYQDVAITLENGTQRLLDLINSVPKRVFQQETSPEKWSIAKVCQHLINTDNNITRILTEPTSPTVDRNPEAKLEKIKDSLLNEKKKMKATGVLVPKKIMKDKHHAIHGIMKPRDQMLLIIHRNDLSRTCPGYSHPQFGIMTAIEWVYFCIYHSDRHIKQIERLLQEFENKTVE